jgi:hypothetical protein
MSLRPAWTTNIKFLCQKKHYKQKSHYLRWFSNNTVCLLLSFAKKEYGKRTFILFYSFVVLGIEPRALHMLSKCFPTEQHPQPWEILWDFYQWHYVVNAFSLCCFWMFLSSTLNFISVNSCTCEFELYSFLGNGPYM